MSLLAALFLLTVGLGILCRLAVVPRSAVRLPRRKKAVVPVVLPKDDRKLYRFPHAGLDSGRAFQYLCCDNSSVGLVIVEQKDRWDRRGYVETIYDVPLVDSWTRLQKHLDALQSYLQVDRRPTLAVVDNKLKLRVVYWVPVPEWRELTRLGRADLGQEDSLDYLTRFQRFRITGGSEAGKSPTAQRIALALADKYQCVPELSNPQSYSNKNHWSTRFKLIARTHNEQFEAISEVANDVIDRGSRPGSKGVRVVVFDELDSTVSFLNDKELREMKRAVMMTIKQASHQNICCLYLGQSSNANLIPGVSKSDWMSLVTVAIGNTGLDYISKSTCLTTKQKGKLIDSYSTMLSKADSSNRGEVNRGMWIRPAVVADPSSVELIVLPVFC